MRVAVLGAGIMGTGLSITAIASVVSRPERVVGFHWPGAGAGRGFYEYPPGAHEALIRDRDRRLIALKNLVTPAHTAAESARRMTEGSRFLLGRPRRRGVAFTR